MFHRQPVALYCLCMGVGLLGVLGSMTPILSDAEESLGLSMLYMLRGPEKTPADVVVVAIDSESAKVLKLPLTPNKWPRLLHSRLLEQLSARHVAVIAFDMIFHEPQAELSDQRLAAAMRHADNVVLTQTIDRQTVPLSDQDGARTTHLNIEQMISAIPSLAEAAIGQAPFPLPKVPIQLNQFWCFRSESADVPTLPVVAFHIYARKAFADFIGLLHDVDSGCADIVFVPENGVYDGRAIIQMIRPLHILFEKNTSLAATALEKLSRYPPEKMTADNKRLIRALINLYRHGNSRYLNLYGPPGTIRTVSYHHLVTEPVVGQAEESPQRLKDAAVFVGQTGSNWIKTHDGFYTAFSGKSGLDTSGVEIAATAFANLLEDKAVYPLRPAFFVLLLLGWGVLAAVISLRFSTALSAAGLLLLNGMYLTAAYAHFKFSGIWYPLVVPVLVQTPAAFITGLIWKYRNATIERQNIREAFGHYLPDEVVDRLSADLKELKLGGQVFYGVCLFTDAQNYTTLSERMDPSSLTQLMNTYYEAIFQPIKANGGLVLQVVGDSMLALWTAPKPEGELKNSACRAAIEITAAVGRFNGQAGACAMPTRIGIHAGDMLLGNIGTIDHFEYRPVGDIVNTASRLEGLNKFIGTHMLASHEAIGRDNGFMSRSVGRFVFKGKSQPVHVYELLPMDKHTPDAQAAVCRMFGLGLYAFCHGRWDEGEKWFNQVLEIDATDGPSLFYLNRCREFQGMLPNGDWDGTVHLERK